MRAVIIGFAAAASLLCLAPAALAEPCEAPHIQAHLSVVEAELLAADTSQLTRAQRANRARHVEALRAYREACSFPRNTAWADRITPIFVDDRGVHCAVGHLMAQDGRHDLVASVRDTRNTASIQELADDAAIAKWLAEAGLTAHEAARIQPGYCFYSKSHCLCGDNNDLMVPASAVAEGVIEEVQTPGGPLRATLRVTRVHGASETAQGDVIEVSPVPGDYPGRRALVIPGAPEYRDRRDQDIDETTVSCTSGAHGDTAQVSLPKDVYVAALMSEDCQRALHSYDPGLQESVCGDPAAPTLPSLDEGCAAGSSQGAWPWLLLAFAALLATAARKRRTLTGADGDTAIPR